MVKKRNRGEDSSFAFLTEEQVRRLRTKDEKVVSFMGHTKRTWDYVDRGFSKEVAKQYGISIKTLRAIRNYHTWRHVVVHNVEPHWHKIEHEKKEQVEKMLKARQILSLRR